MAMRTTENIRRMEAAKRRLAGIKDFHNHFIGYLIVNTILFAIHGEVVQFISQGNSNLQADFLEWVDLNILLTPVLWGFGLLVHGLYAYRYKLSFIARWEARQIRKLMESA